MSGRASLVSVIDKLSEQNDFTRIQTELFFEFSQHCLVWGFVLIDMPARKTDAHLSGSMVILARHNDAAIFQNRDYDCEFHKVNLIEIVNHPSRRNLDCLLRNTHKGSAIQKQPVGPTFSRYAFGAPRLVTQRPP